MRAAKDIGCIVPATAIAILLFYFLARTGAIEALRYLFDQVLGLVGLPEESSAALVARFLRSFAVYAIVASLFWAGILSLRQALLTRIVGSMPVMTLLHLRYALPINLSLRGDRASGDCLHLRCGHEGEDRHDRGGAPASLNHPSKWHYRDLDA